MYRLNRVVVENILRCVEFQWNDDGKSVTTLKGKNGAGKSSIQKGILMALLGAGAVPEEVLRNGATSWRTEVVLKGQDEHADIVLTIVRAGRTDGSGTLSITASDGQAVRSPQAMLDKIISRVALDPVKILSLPAQEQYKLLVQAAGVTYDLDDHEKKRGALYAQRTMANRNAKTLEAQARAGGLRGDLNRIAGQAAPAVDDLVAELQRANKTNEQRRVQESELADCGRWIITTTKEIEALDKQLAEKRAGVAEAKVAKVRMEAELAKMDYIDTTELQSGISRAQLIGAQAANAKLALQRWEAVDRAEAESQQLTRQMDALDTAKLAALAQAKLPAGLSVCEDGAVRYRGRLFAEASTAERLTVAFEVAAMLRPDLKIVFVDEASVLDDEHLLIIERMADKFGLQVWLNAVDHGQPGILIEDGVVKS